MWGSSSAVAFSADTMPEMDVPNLTDAQRSVLIHFYESSDPHRRPLRSTAWALVRLGLLSETIQDSSGVTENVDNQLLDARPIRPGRSSITYQITDEGRRVAEALDDPGVTLPAHVSATTPSGCHRQSTLPAPLTPSS